MTATNRVGGTRTCRSLSDRWRAQRWNPVAGAWPARCRLEDVVQLSESHAARGECSPPHCEVYPIELDAELKDRLLGHASTVRRAVTSIARRRHLRSAGWGQMGLTFSRRAVVACDVQRGI